MEMATTITLRSASPELPVSVQVKILPARVASQVPTDVPMTAVICAFVRRAQTSMGVAALAAGEIAPPRQKIKIAEKKESLWRMADSSDERPCRARCGDSSKMHSAGETF